MLIRSQDKKSIINLDNITDISLQKTRIENFEIVACFPYTLIDDCGAANIGNYSTEEKAIKVLDMISQNYAESEKYIIRRSFQMPQDSEVNV